MPGGLGPPRGHPGGGVGAMFRPPGGSTPPWSRPSPSAPSRRPHPGHGHPLPQPPPGGADATPPFVAHHLGIALCTRGASGPSWTCCWTAEPLLRRGLPGAQLATANLEPRLVTSLYAFANQMKLPRAGPRQIRREIAIGYYAEYGDGSIEYAAPWAELTRAEVRRLAAHLDVPRRSSTATVGRPVGRPGRMRARWASPSGVGRLPPPHRAGVSRREGPGRRPERGQRARARAPRVAPSPAPEEAAESRRPAVPVCWLYTPFLSQRCSCPSPSPRNTVGTRRRRRAYRRRRAASSPPTARATPCARGLGARRKSSWR